jgi:hypothetical protein
LNDIIENYKNYNKRAKKNNKKSKEEGSNWNCSYYHWKNKIYKLNLKNKIENHKIFNKNINYKNKKLKVKVPIQNLGES